MRHPALMMAFVVAGVAVGGAAYFRTTPGADMRNLKTTVVAKAEKDQSRIEPTICGPDEVEAIGSQGRFAGCVGE